MGVLADTLNSSDPIFLILNKMLLVEVSHLCLHYRKSKSPLGEEQATFLLLSVASGC